MPKNISSNFKGDLNFPYISELEHFGRWGGGGGFLNFEWPYLQEYSSDLLQILICSGAHLGLSESPKPNIVRSYGHISENYLYDHNF